MPKETEITDATRLLSPLVGIAHIHIKHEKADDKITHVKLAIDPPLKPRVVYDHSKLSLAAITQWLETRKIYPITLSDGSIEIRLPELLWLAKKVNSGEIEMLKPHTAVTIKPDESRLLAETYRLPARSTPSNLVTLDAGTVRKRVHERKVQKEALDFLHRVFGLSSLSDSEYLNAEGVDSYVIFLPNHSNPVFNHEIDLKGLSSLLKSAGIGAQVNELPKNEQQSGQPARNGLFISRVELNDQQKLQAAIESYENVIAKKNDEQAVPEKQKPETCTPSTAQAQEPKIVSLDFWRNKAGKSEIIR